MRILEDLGQEHRLIEKVAGSLVTFSEQPSPPAEELGSFCDVFAVFAVFADAHHHAKRCHRPSSKRRREVHRVLGPGLFEGVYEQALELELLRVAFVRQPVIAVAYKDRLVGELRADLLVRGRLIVELKTVDRLAPIHLARRSFGAESVVARPQNPAASSPSTSRRRSSTFGGW